MAGHRRRLRIVVGAVLALLFVSGVLGALAHHTRNAATREREYRRTRLLEETLASAGWRDRRVTSVSLPEGLLAETARKTWADLGNMQEQLQAALAAKNDVVAASRAIECLRITNTIVSYNLAKFDTASQMASHYGSGPDPLGMTDVAYRQSALSFRQIERAVTLRQTYLSLLRLLATNATTEVRIATFELIAQDFKAMPADQAAQSVRAWLKESLADQAVQAVRASLKESLRLAYAEEDDARNVTRMETILDQLHIEKSPRYPHFAFLGWLCSTEMPSVLSNTHAQFRVFGYTCARSGNQRAAP